MLGASLTYGLALTAPSVLAHSVTLGYLPQMLLMVDTNLLNALTWESATARPVNANASLDTLVMVANAVCALTTAVGVESALPRSTLLRRLLRHTLLGML